MTRLEKEFKSFSKKMKGSNYIWFESLFYEKKYDLFYEWKRYKYNNVLIKPKKIYIKTWPIVVVSYPPSLKHFIKSRRKLFKYSTKVSDVRNTIIDILLK